MLTPSRTRYRKPHRGRTRGKAYRGCDVLYGEYGLMALEPGWIKANHIEACRVSISRRIKKFGKMWIRLFPDKPYTKKPAETRQGKGKGNVEGYVAVVRPGQIMFEVRVTDNEPLCREALTRAMHKLPVKCKIVEKLELK